MAVNDYGIEIQKEPEMVMVPIADYEAEKMRLQELESENKKLEDYIDAYQKSEAINIAKLDEKDERIKELELALSNAVAGGNIALEQAKKLESQLPKWISVKDRLPPKGQHVLVVRNHRLRSLYPIDVVCWSEDYITHDIVTHWMPLPPPPTTEEK